MKGDGTTKRKSVSDRALLLEAADALIAQGIKPKTARLVKATGIVHYMVRYHRSILHAAGIWPAPICYGGGSIPTTPRKRYESENEPEPELSEEQQAELERRIGVAYTVRRKYGTRMTEEHLDRALRRFEQEAVGAVS